MSPEQNSLWKPFLPFCCLWFQEPRTCSAAVPSSSFFPSFPWRSLLVYFQPATAIFACMSLLMYLTVHFFFIASKTKFSDIPSKFLLILIFSDSLYFLNLKHYSIRLTSGISNILIVSGSTLFHAILYAFSLPLVFLKAALSNLSSLLTSLCATGEWLARWRVSLLTPCLDSPCSSWMFFICFPLLFHVFCETHFFKIWNTPFVKLSLSRLQLRSLNISYF